MNNTASPSSADLLQRSDRLEDYLQQDPSNVQLLADAFEAAMAAGRTDAAEAHVRTALTSSVDAAPWTFRLASCAIARDDLATALELLTGLPSTARAQPAVRFNLALVYYRLKDYRACTAALAPLVDDAASDRHGGPEAQAMWLRAMHRCGDVEQAWEWVAYRLQAARQLTPEVCGVASLVALDADHLDEAQVLSAHALQGLPGQAEALVAQGSIALGQGDAVLATACAQSALQAHAEDGRTRSLLGFARLLAQDLQGALVNFERAVVLMPEHIGTWQGLGWTQLLLGDLDAAVRAFDAALALDRNFAENHGAMAVALAMQAHVPQAEAALERALRLDPTVASAQYAKLLLGGQGRDPAAVQRLAQRLLTGLSRRQSPRRPD